MKKRINLWLVMFLAISLALPIYSMADMKMTLMTKDGDTITSSPGIMNFFMSNDGTLSIILESPLDQPFRFASTDPDIGIVANPGGNCTIPGDGSVTMTVGNAYSFGVASATTGAAITSVALPGGSFSNGIYQWTPQASDIGTYLAVFQADAAGTGTAPKTSQIVVMIKVNPAETVTAPTVSGPSTGAPSVSYQFTASGSTSTLSHAIEYQFDWGDGNQSGWSASPQSHSWGTASTTPYNIKAKARCVPDHVESAWSGTSSITISNIPTYTVTVSVVNPAGGSVSPMSVSGIASNGQATFTVTINNGFTASVSPGSLSGTTWTITNVTSDIPNATATFTQQNTTTCQSGDLPSSSRLAVSVTGQTSWHFCITGNPPSPALLVQAVGTTNETNATLTWTFPEGNRVFPTDPNQGLLLGTGTQSVSMRLRSTSAPSPNIPDSSIPSGRHTLTITGTFTGFMSAEF